MRRTFWMRRLGLLALIAAYGVAAYGAVTGYALTLAVAGPLWIIGYLGLTARPRECGAASYAAVMGTERLDAGQIIHFDWPPRP